MYTLKNNMENDESIEKQVAYYDARSANYSLSRYPEITTNYQQYLFKKRLQLFLVFLENMISSLPEKPSILEIGCADGILSKQIENKFPGVFTRLVGVDVSPMMIEEAKKQNTSSNITFLLRNNLPQEKFDIVIELGVHVVDLEKELSYVTSHLKQSGYFFYDVAGNQSIYFHIKLEDKDYAEDYKTYTEYDSLFQKVFIVRKSKVYGLFVPKIWKSPFLGRVIQPLVELIFRPMFPNLFHEKLYFLEKSGESGFDKK